MGYLIDSNVLSELRKPKRVEQVTGWFRRVTPSELFTSVLVLAELRRGSLLVRRRDPASADHLDRWISDLEAAFEDRVLAVSSAVADRWAELMVPDPVPVIDGLLAATALVHGHTLVTRNTKDVARTGVNVLDPFQLPP
jgi:predicted nucleic acid-binding protein